MNNKTVNIIPTTIKKKKNIQNKLKTVRNKFK